jgi:hypothetical protein
MDKRTKGAWLLSHSKKLDHTTGTQRFENIHYAGKIGRLYSVLRRETAGSASVDISAETVLRLCQLNNIDVSARREGLRALKAAERIEIGTDGSIEILGATTRAVLESTADFFDEFGENRQENALLLASELTSSTPQNRDELIEEVSDTYAVTKPTLNSLIDVAHSAALIDQETYRDKTIIFSQNIFRDGERAKKVFYLLQTLSESDASLVTEAQDLLRSKGAVFEADIAKILGEALTKRLLGVGFFDRMEVNNESEAVGYFALPDAFQRYGRPFEEDPVDDAKALLASLTYGMTRSPYTRGNVSLPKALVQKLVDGGEVGDHKPVQAIGEDYREVERRGVVQVNPRGNGRYSMTLLKKDVGELALAIIQGKSASEESLMMTARAATSFKGPEENRTEVRQLPSITDKKFVTEALNSIRNGD